MNENMRLLSGMRPVEELNLKHILVLNELKKLQEDYTLFFSIDDMTALTSDRTGRINEKTLNTFKELLICGFDPAECVIFNQSLVPEGAQMLQILMELLPAKMFMRNPVYRKKLAAGEQPALGVMVAPLYELVDVLLYKTQYISTSMNSTVEIIRGAIRRLEKIGMFGDEKTVLPQMLVSPIPDIVGIDGSRVDSQKKNFFSPNDSLEELRQKALSIPFPNEQHNSAGKCIIADYASVLKSSIHCSRCDASCGEHLSTLLWDFFAEYRSNKENFSLNDEDIKKVFCAGIERARYAAGKSLFEYMKALKLIYKE